MRSPPGGKLYFYSNLVDQCDVKFNYRSVPLLSRNAMAQ